VKLIERKGMTPLVELPPGPQVIRRKMLNRYEYSYKNYYLAMPRLLFLPQWYSNGYLGGLHVAALKKPFGPTTKLYYFPLPNIAPNTGYVCMSETGVPNSMGRCWPLDKKEEAYKAIINDFFGITFSYYFSARRHAYPWRSPTMWTLPRWEQKTRKNPNYDPARGKPMRKINCEGWFLDRCVF